MVQLANVDQEKVVNLARRYTNDAENDLLQASLYDEAEEPPIPQPSQEQVVNLARRFTASAENDLLQESLYDPSEEPVLPEKLYDKKTCEEIAQHVVHAASLPAQCNQFPSAVQAAKSHDKDITHPTQILS
jgi:hypothetical protein